MAKEIAGARGITRSRANEACDGDHSRPEHFCRCVSLHVDLGRRACADEGNCQHGKSGSIVHVRSGAREQDDVHADLVCDEDVENPEYQQQLERDDVDTDEQRNAEWENEWHELRGELNQGMEQGKRAVAMELVPISNVGFPNSEKM